MTKTMAALFGFIVLIITYYGVIAPDSIVSFTLDTQRSATVARATLTILICAYYFGEKARNTVTMYAMRIIGLSLLYLGFAGLFTTQLSETFNYFVRPIDIFFAIEGGVLALLGSLDLSLTRSKPAALPKARQTKKIPALSSPQAKQKLHPA